MVTNNIIDLPDAILHHIFALCSSVMDLPVHRSICSRICHVLSQPTYLLERRRQGTAQEMLVFAGGVHRPFGRSAGFGKKRSSASRSMTPIRKIYAFVPSLKSWKVFGRVRISESCSFDEFDDYHYCLEGRPLPYLERVEEYRVVHIWPEKLVFLGGVYIDEGGLPSDEVWSYSFSSNTWEQLPSMIRKRSSKCFQAIVVGSNILVFGCEDEFYDSNNYSEKFCWHEQRWTSIGDVPSEVDDFLITSYSPYELYLIGNSASVAFLYNMKCDSWIQLDVTNVLRRQSAGIITNTNGEIILIGGFYDGSDVVRLNDNERIAHNDHLNLVDSIRDPGRGKNVTRCAKLPIKKSDVVSCVFRRCVTVLGGRTGFSSKRVTGENKIWQLNEKMSKWTPISDIKSPPLPGIVGAHAFSLWL